MNEPDTESSIFGTKAATLERLRPRLDVARLCEQIVVPVALWRRDPGPVVAAVLARFGPRRLAVRSSAEAEDGWNASHAGAHLSRLNVEADARALAAAVDDVFASYRRPSPGDEVLVQPMVEKVAISGVVLSRDLDTGSPYYVVNYDDFSGLTGTVTGGAVSKTILVHRAAPDALKSPRMRRLIEGVAEIERVARSDEIDVEFCITEDGTLYVLQVRPLAAKRHWRALPDSAVDAALAGVRAQIAACLRPEPGLAGATTILGEMPDWNPAEMIGNTPRPLALSLYRRLITDAVWAEARAGMGYRRVAGPLLVEFLGRPYVDVRRSLNSFLPAALDEGLARRLVDWQLARLAERPELHDKIEFEIATTCRDFSFGAARERMRGAGFAPDDLAGFESGLARLTQAALGDQPRALDAILAAAERGLEPSAEIGRAGAAERVRRMLAQCADHGTRPFAVLARHAFIGVSFLRSLAARGVFAAADVERFLGGVRTVATELVDDMRRLGAGQIEERDFLARYGHLRPGTYDVTSWRYDERPALFLRGLAREPEARPAPFRPSPAQRAGIESLLAEPGYGLGSDDLLAYIAAAIAARERCKFAFTRSVSDILSVLAEWGERSGLTPDDVSFLPIDAILAEPEPGRLGDRIAEERDRYHLARAIRLPHLIGEPSDIDVVRLPLGQPTFITAKIVTAPSARLAPAETPEIDGRIVLIESADPGFDWIFSRRLVGLITKFGGANSHMAIRCAEFGLPAAIGCGERYFETVAKMAVIELNCASRRITGR